MTTPDTSHYRTLLQTRRQDLLAQLSQLRSGATSRVEASNAHFSEREPDSRAQMLSERELEFALDERETTEIAAIDAALERIDDGTYGICIECGEAIYPARLLAAPESERCIACQSRAEQSPSP